MGAAVVPLLAVSAGLAVVGGIARQNQIQDQVNSAGEQAQIDIAEATRQQSAAQRETTARKSEIVRSADKDLASMQVAMIEMGGAGSLNERRLGAEISYIAGLNLTREDQNLESRVAALQSEKISAARGARAAQRAGKHSMIANSLGVAGQVANVGVAAADFKQRADTAANTQTS